MKHSYQGFSIIHMLMYMICMSLVMLIIMQWTSSVCLFGKKHQKHNERYSVALIVSDVIARDIRSSHRCVHQDIASHIVQSGDDYIGWELRKGKLIRSYGDYDTVNAVWLTRKKGVIAMHVQHFNMSWVGKHVVRIILEMQSITPCSIERYVASRPGVYL